MAALHRVRAGAALVGGEWYSDTPEVDYVGRQQVQHRADGLLKVSGVVALVAVAMLFPGYVDGAAPRAYTMVSTSVPPAPSAIPLPPNEQGYVRVETASGSVGCSISPEVVSCQTFSRIWQNGDGRPYHTVSVSADGDFQQVNADLGALEGRVRLSSQTYSAQGWTIVATTGDTVFTNDRSHHGMTVGERSVVPF